MWGMLSTLSHACDMSSSDNATSENPDAIHLQLDHVPGLEPAAVAVLEDAACPDRAGAEDVTGPEVRIPCSVRDDGVPGVMHVTEISTRALLPVDTRSEE